MIHLVKNSNNTFDVGTVVNGRLIWHTSPQQYEKRGDAIKAIRSGMKSFGSGVCAFQDDTKDTSVIYLLYEKGAPEKSDRKPHKKYTPQSKKK